MQVRSAFDQVYPFKAPGCCLGFRLYRATKMVAVEEGAILILTALIFALITIGAAAYGQTPQPGRARLQFEVASVKMAARFSPAEFASGTVHVGMRLRPPRVSIGFATLEALIAQAYEVDRSQVRSAIALTDQPFDIEAIMPDGARREQIPEMLGALLAERFSLRVHREMRKAAVYVLRTGDNGARLKSGIHDFAGETIVVTVGGSEVGLTIQELHGITHVELREMSMEILAKALASILTRPVLDRTGLEGNYQIAIDYENSSPISVRRSLRTVGLNLESAWEPVDFIVVDHVDKLPIEN